MTYLLPDASVAMTDSMIWSDPDDRTMNPNLSYRYNRSGRSLYWPATGIGACCSLSQSILSQNPSFEPSVDFRRGAQSQRTISGVTFDATGTPLANVTVKAYRTAADVQNSLVADAQEGPAAVSNAAGEYTAYVPNVDAHYLVGYKTGSPDVAGTTLNTLVGL